jgi:hypothetical protein
VAHQHAHSWTGRSGASHSHDSQVHLSPGGLEHHAPGQGFKNPHTSLGVAGHLVHMGAMLFPVLAAELINDAAKYRKAVRIGSVLTTVLYEGLYTARETRRRHRQEEKLAECRNQSER